MRRTAARDSTRFHNFTEVVHTYKLVTEGVELSFRPLHTLQPLFLFQKTNLCVKIVQLP